MSRLQIPFDTTDAEGFKTVVADVIYQLIANFDPDEVCIIRIKNWFDHKWLNYSGDRILAYDTKSNPGIPYALEPYWNRNITIPPFHPNRVLSESAFIKDGKSTPEFLKPFHTFQQTTENIQNHISRRIHNGFCCWISSNSTTNQQGSLMVYQIMDEEVKSWYVSIEKKAHWKVTRTKGISKKHIESLLNVDIISN
jgi:hypothetical protein